MQCQIQCSGTVLCKYDFVRFRTDQIRRFPTVPDIPILQISSPFCDRNVRDSHTIPTYIPPPHFSPKPASETLSPHYPDISCLLPPFRCPTSIRSSDTPTYNMYPFSISYLLYFIYNSILYTFSHIHLLYISHSIIMIKIYSETPRIKSKGCRWSGRFHVCDDLLAIREPAKTGEAGA